jgi:hypothetical protein
MFLQVMQVKERLGDPKAQIINVTLGGNFCNPVNKVTRNGRNKIKHARHCEPFRAFVILSTY